MKQDYEPLTRRAFLKRSALVSVCTVTVRAAANSTGQAEPTSEPAPVHRLYLPLVIHTCSASKAEPELGDGVSPVPVHGVVLRGMELVLKDPSAEGRFGRMFKELPAYTPDEDLLMRLGAHMEEPFRSPPATPEENDTANDNPNPALTTGFTFLGQFLDHDITFDPTPLADQETDPDAVTNFRTPRYDLDAMYGRGPVEDPQLYHPQDRDKLLIVVNEHGVEDVPRGCNGQAQIPDPRNDQHLIIVQLHLAFMKFHNKLVDLLRLQGVEPLSVFALAKRLARWHYQWLVLHDFLPRVVGQAMADQVYKEVVGTLPVVTLKYYKPTNAADRPFMPVEFAAAAYRFGHSITRPRYTMSSTVSKVPLFVEPLDSTNFDNALNGSRPVPSRLKIQWSRFFNDPQSTATTAKPVRKLDATLAFPLFILPKSVIPSPDRRVLLAGRNLLRQRTLGLASGQQVARQIGAPVLSNAELGLTAIDVRWKNAPWNEAPLWYYILKEAELLKGTRELGPVGGRIVAEVLVGLLQRDTSSYLNLNPAWKPLPPIAPAIGQFTMVDLLKFTEVWT